MSEQRDWTPAWAILELMGHVRLGGFVSEAVIAGAACLRIDVPGPEPGQLLATQYYGGGALYCLTPTTEQIARAVAATGMREPATPWELRQLPQSTGGDGYRDPDHSADDDPALLDNDDDEEF